MIGFSLRFLLGYNKVYENEVFGIVRWSIKRRRVLYEYMEFVKL